MKTMLEVTKTDGTSAVTLSLTLGKDHLEVPLSPTQCHDLAMTLLTHGNWFVTDSEGNNWYRKENTE